MLSTEELKELLVVKFPDTVRDKQLAEQAWIHFVDFLDKCDGKLNSCVLFVKIMHYY